MSHKTIAANIDPRIRDLVEESCTAQGIDVHITDAGTLARIARLLAPTVKQ